MNIIFFGSTSDSVIVANALYNASFHPIAVVTQPAKSAGRTGTVTPTPVEVWAKSHTITVLTFPTETDKPWNYQNKSQVVDTLSALSPDILISASYGQGIPAETIKQARYGGVNVHPSLLPRWRGTDPIPWAILSGDAQMGVSVVTLLSGFDEGEILAQKKISTPETLSIDELRADLFGIGATLLTETLPNFIEGKHMGNVQNSRHATYARRLTRDDGYIPWNVFLDAIHGTETNPTTKVLTFTNAATPVAIIRAIRALSDWPGVWTNISLNKESAKRLKILKAHVDGGKLILDTVQLEGKKPVPFSQFVSAYPSVLDKQTSKTVR